MSRRTLNSTVAKTTPGNNARLQGFHKYEINEDVPESVKNPGSAARASGPSASSAADELVHLKHIVACRNQYYHNAPVPMPSDEILIDIVNDTALKFSKTLLQQVEDYKATQALLSDLDLFPRCLSQTCSEPVQCNDVTAAATNAEQKLPNDGNTDILEIPSKYSLRFEDPRDPESNSSSLCPQQDYPRAAETTWSSEFTEQPSREWPSFLLSIVLFATMVHNIYRHLRVLSKASRSRPSRSPCSGRRTRKIRRRNNLPKRLPLKTFFGAFKPNRVFWHHYSSSELGEIGMSDHEPYLLLSQTPAAEAGSSTSRLKSPSQGDQSHTRAGACKDEQKLPLNANRSSQDSIPARLFEDHQTAAYQAQAEALPSPPAPVFCVSVSASNTAFVTLMPFSYGLTPGIVALHRSTPYGAKCIELEVRMWL